MRENARKGERKATIRWILVKLELALEKAHEGPLVVDLAALGRLAPELTQCYTEGTRDLQRALVAFRRVAAILEDTGQAVTVDEEV